MEGVRHLTSRKMMEDEFNTEESGEKQSFAESYHQNLIRWSDTKGMIQYICGAILSRGMTKSTIEACRFRHEKFCYARKKLFQEVVWHHKEWGLVFEFMERFARQCGKLQKNIERFTFTAPKGKA